MYSQYSLQRVTLQRRHRHGLDDLDYDHYYERQKLKELQKQDISIIPPDIISASKKSGERKPKSNERNKRGHSIDKDERTKHRYSIDQDESNKKSKSMSPNHNPIPPPLGNRNLISNVHVKHQFVADNRPNGPPTVAGSNRPPIIANSGSTGPPIVASTQKPPLVINHRSNEPPTVKAAHNDHSKAKGFSNPKEKRHSDTTNVSKEVNLPDKSTMSKKMNHLNNPFGSKDEDRYANPSKRPILENKQQDSPFSNKKQRTKSRAASSINNDHLSPAPATSSNRKARWNSSSRDNIDVQPSSKSDESNTLPKTIGQHVPSDSDNLVNLSQTGQPSIASPLPDVGKGEAPLQIEKRMRQFSKDSTFDTSKGSCPSSSSAPPDKPTSVVVPRDPQKIESLDQGSLSNTSPQNSPSYHKNGNNKDKGADFINERKSRWDVLSNKESLPATKANRPNSPLQNTTSIAVSTVELSQPTSSLKKVLSPTRLCTLDASAASVTMIQKNTPLSNSSRASSPISKNIQSSSLSHTNTATHTIELSQLNMQLNQEFTSSKDDRPLEAQADSHFSTAVSTPMTTIATDNGPTGHIHSNELSTTDLKASSSDFPIPNKKSETTTTINTRDSSNSRKPQLSNGFRFQPPKAPTSRRIVAPTINNAASHMIWNAPPKPTISNTSSHMIWNTPPEPTIDTNKISGLLGIDRPVAEPTADIDTNKLHELLGINPPPANYHSPRMDAFSGNLPSSIVIPPRPRSRKYKNKEPSRAIAPPTIQDSNESSNIDANGNGPLFVNNKHSHRRSKVFSLIDNGQIVIRSKPSRVVINVNGTSKAYGDPKDYDDAINNVYRANNPVHKRMMDRTQYLFYKQESGAVVAIGPVSKIQPLIHQYFLAR
jgi:hypothetical protein